MSTEIKAKELVEKFKPYMYCYRGSGMLSNDYDEKIVMDYAKYCAIICVDEILKGDHLIRTPLSFWQQVKTEIQKL
jgi:hypothetical protein